MQCSPGPPVCFFSKERKRETSWTVPSSGLVENESSTVINQTQREAFGQVKLRVTRHLTASSGLRIGRSSYDGVTETPPLTSAEAVDTSVTPRFDLTYRTDGGTLLYGDDCGRVSKWRHRISLDGFVATTLPRSYPSDTLWNYEIGAKTDVLDGQVHLETSVFHMDWFITTSRRKFGGDAVLTGLTALRGSAASNGFDLLVQALITERIQIWSDRGLYRRPLTLKQSEWTTKWRFTTCDALGSPPQVPSPWNVTTSIDYHFPLSPTINVETQCARHLSQPKSGSIYCVIGLR
jgi:hypothetical protein